MYRMTLASKLREFRNAAGLTINDVGAHIGKSGKTVSAWECGRGQPDADMLLKLCQLYKVNSISEFFDQPSAVVLSADEVAFLEIFRSLNSDGQKEILKHARYIQSQAEYKKYSQPVDVSKEA